MTTFHDFNFNPNVIKKLTEQGITTPTDIQKETFEKTTSGKDVFALAQTGSGKTLAFALPIMERILRNQYKPTEKHPRAIILAPTRELAIQINETFKLYCKDLRIKHTAIYGGAPFKPQFIALSKPIDIVIGTPGRILDHINRKNIILDDCEMICLDEADRMLDMGFVSDIETVMSYMQDERQTILFSATANKQIRSLVSNILSDYELIEIKSEIKIPETISHKLIQLNRDNKNEAMIDILNNDDVNQAVVFTKTKHGADDIAKILNKNGYMADAIHGDKKQNVRQKILRNFQTGKIGVLVATDVMARGIDVKTITHVINYNLPNDPENYAHRVGRTGRAGRSGVAYTLLSKDELNLLIQIERFLDLKIDIDHESPYHIEIDRNRRGPKTGGRNFGKNRFGGGGGRGGFNRNKPNRSRDDKTSYGERGDKPRDGRKFGSNNKSNDSRGSNRNFDKKKSGFGNKNLRKSK